MVLIEDVDDEPEAGWVFSASGIDRDCIAIEGFFSSQVSANPRYSRRFMDLEFG